MPGYIEPAPEFGEDRVLWAFAFAVNLAARDDGSLDATWSRVSYRRSPVHLRALLVELDLAMRSGAPAHQTLARVALAVAQHPVIRLDVSEPPVEGWAKEWTARVGAFAAWELVDEQARRDGRRLAPGSRQKLVRLLMSSETTFATVAAMIEQSLQPMQAIPTIVFIQPAEDLPDREAQENLGKLARSVRLMLKGSPVRVREPLPQFRPDEADDADPRTIYGVERPRLLDASLLVVQLDRYSSPGCHRAVEWLQGLGARVLVFSRDGSGNGRGTGAGPYNTEYLVDLSEAEMVDKVVAVYRAEYLDLQAHAADRMRVRRENSRARGILADALAKRPNPPIGISSDRIRELLRDVSEFETLSTYEWTRLVAYAGPAVVNIMDIILGIEREPVATAESTVKAPPIVLKELAEARDAIKATGAEVDYALREMVAQFERELLVGSVDPWKTFTRRWFVDVILRFRGRS